MVSRIFVAVGRRPRFVEVPRVFVRAALPMLGLLPGFRGVSVAAFDRMNEPLVADNAARRARGLPEHAADGRLLAALASGLPPCSGVAVGFDRAVMVATGAPRIDDVIAFTTEQA
ncbi:MAG: hypothetical protein EBS39_12845 [Gammaproteobacteria bacterium]|nr:hypothetical protein [Gammaproteobacteria bacterium]